MTTIRNALTVDVEDYFRQIDPATWDRFDLCVERTTHRLLDLFAEQGVQVTFFVLGWVAERCSGLVREIAERGHEVACHGYSHQLIYGQAPAVFREETVRAKACLEDQAQRPVLGYRAASYSITLRSLWALDILADVGFSYDSSIFPIHHDRYGIAGSPHWPYRLTTPNDGSLIEFPPSTLSIFGYHLPVAAGGYFRLYPYRFTRSALAHLSRSEGQPFIFYLHPWEIDRDSRASAPVCCPGSGTIPNCAIAKHGCARCYRISTSRQFITSWRHSPFSRPVQPPTWHGSKFAVRMIEGLGARLNKKMPPTSQPPLLSPRDAIPPDAATPAAEKHSYGQILKASALIGGSSALNIAIGMVRTKAMALFLGPAGFGLMGLYGSIADLVQSIATLGINSSGVRQIAEAVGSGDAGRIARTVVVLRRISIVLGLLGAVPLIVLSKQVSVLTFGEEQYASAVALLSAAVFFRCVSAGQKALIQGMRRMRDLAKMSVLGAVYGILISVPVVYFFRVDGVVPSLVGVAAMGIVTSWWYSRKVQIQRPSMTVSEVSQEAAPLLKLGFAFMASGLMMMGSAYAIRIIVLRTMGFEALGLYQSAWTLGGLYVGFILDAMGTDFYPRLTAVASDNTACNRMVNEQAEISLLLAGPGVLATLTFAPAVIAIFYTAAFGEAVSILRWICLGMSFRVITWPMGYIIVAKGAQTIFFWTELAWTIVYIGLVWACVRLFGLNGTGIAFFGSYILHWLIIYPFVRRLSGFRWSAANRQTGALFLSSLAAVFCGFYLLPPLLAYCIGTLTVILSGAYSIRLLLNVISTDRVPLRILRFLVWLRLAPCES